MLLLFVCVFHGGFYTVRPLLIGTKINFVHCDLQEKSSVEVSIEINPEIIGSDPALGAQNFHFQN